MTKHRRNPIPGICRMDQTETHNHGFFVRVQRNYKIYSAFFADQSYGGKRRALAAAKCCLRQLRQKLGPVDRKLWAQRLRGYGASGIAGVSKIVAGRATGFVTYWEARWRPEPYVIRRRKFSVEKYGARQAKLLAIRARRAGVRSMK